MEDFGYTGDTLTGDEIREGNYIPPQGTDEHTHLFLRCLKRPSHVPDGTIPTKFSTVYYINWWKTRRKRTSRSLSGRYFEHYKVLHLLHKNIKMCLPVWKIFHTTPDTLPQDGRKLLMY